MSAAPHPTETPTMIRARQVVEARGAQVRAASGNSALVERGLLDVTAAPYHADPTGERDATTALQQAIEDARDARLITFLPAGRYRVSDTLEGIQGVVTWDDWPYGAADAMVEYRSYCYPCTLGGDRGDARATLFLAPGTPGFDDPDHPKPIVFFWSREETRQPETGQADPTRSQFNISFNQQILDLDFDLGANPGAIGIEHQGAQGSTVAHVNVNAVGAHAGLRGLCGSGGGTHAVTVTGGRYGILAQRDHRQRGSQPVPVVSDVRLTAQTEAALHYEGRGPLTLVGARIHGAGLAVASPEEPIWNGPLNVVDSQLEITGGGPAISSSHPVCLHHVYLRGASVALAEIGARGRRVLLPTATGWFRLDAWSSASGHDPAFRAVDTPDDSVCSSHHLAPLPDWRSAASVKETRFGAAGDGQTDDTAALQAALDSCDDVFLPPGEYLVSKPLRLRATTRLFGTNPAYCTLLADETAPVFRNALEPQPVVLSPDDATATTVIAAFEIMLPVGLAGAYALEWRAGRGSVVRTVNFERSLWDPDAPGLFHPLVRIAGRGGGSWYEFQVTSWWTQSPLYRHLLVNGTTEPLRFYMLNPEHARSEAQCELRDAANIRIYSCKGEGNYPVLWINRCRAVQLFGYGGNGAAWPGWSNVRTDHSTDVLLVGMTPQAVNAPPGKWTALGIPVGSARGPLLTLEGQPHPDGHAILWHRIP